MKPNYHECYRVHVMKMLANTLIAISREDCNRWLIMDKVLGGTAFDEIHHRENPKYLNMGAPQILETIEFEDAFDWQATSLQPGDEEIDETILWWEGRLLAYFQWKYSIDFKDWLKYENTKSVYEIYYPLHEASYDNAADKLYERYRYYKKHKIFREQTS